MARDRTPRAPVQSGGVSDNLASMAAGIIAGERRALARAITLIESTRADDRGKAIALLEELIPATGGAIRIGITGVPGVGKSTFIEAFGLDLLDRGCRVAVLAVDPSSPRTGGSILGDKTRMEGLARHPDAFIRPSPSGGTLGGVARRTGEVMLAVEAAGFGVVLIETVGTGQSEFAVADLADLFMLLVAPGGGDELQGIKKGIVELADLVVVTKADGDLAPAAARAQRDYSAALHMLRPGRDGWTPRVLTCSAFAGDGFGDIWHAVSDFRETLDSTGEREHRRAQRRTKAMWEDISETLVTRLRDDPDVAMLANQLETEVEAGRLPPAAAAERLLAAFKPV